MSTRGLKRRPSSFYGSQPGNPRYRRRKKYPSFKRQQRGFRNYPITKTNPYSLYGCDSVNFVNIGGIGAPKEMRVKMVFEESWPDTTVVPGFAAYIWKGNALFDPDPALGGATASGARMWSYIYKRYRVVGSQAMLEVINNDTDTGVKIALYATAQGALPTVARINGIAGLPGCISKTVVNQTGREIISAYARTAQVVGLKDDSDVGFQGNLCTSDPTHLWYWATCIWSDAGVALTCECRMRIVYDVIMSEPNFSYMAEVQ